MGSFLVRLWIVIFLTGSTAVYAQKNTPAKPTYNPALTAEIDGIENDDTGSDDLRFRNLDINFKIYGNVAQGEINATLYNGGEEELEAIFEFALPKGAVVTGYAIDLEDADDNYRDILIDGVLLEKQKAREAYENQVAEQVDPGLANVSREGVFSTNIYPINEESSRKLRLRFTFPVDGNAGLNLPISTRYNVESWNISVEAEGLDAAPVIEILGKSTVKHSGRKYIARASGSDQQLDGALTIAPLSVPAVLITRHDNGREFVQLSGDLPRRRSGNKPEHIRVYWDNSRSRRDDRLDLEAQLLAELGDKIDPTVFELLVFNSEQSTRKIIGSAGDLKATLKGISYVGGSNFVHTEPSDIEAADLCLLISDGIATVDKDAVFDPDCTLHIISSAAEANGAVLSTLARDHGGAFYALDSDNDVARVLAAIMQNSPTLQSVRSDSGKLREFISLPAADGKWAAIVKSQSDTRLKVRLGSAGNRASRTIELTASAERSDGPGALWASDQLLRRENDLDRKAYLQFARDYSVEAPSLSFLVLEDPDDYVRNDIRPPKSYPEEMMIEYAELRKEADEEDAEERAERFSDLLDEWEELKDWWGRKYELAKAKKIRRHDRDGETDEAIPPPPPPPPPASQGSSAAFEAAADAAAPQEESFPGNTDAAGADDVVIVTASRSVPTIDVKVDAWQPERPYLKALDAQPDSFDSVYAEQEVEHGGLPIFYLDVARWLHERKYTDKAVEVLLSALELPVTNAETLTIVARRLQTYGQTNRAIELLEYIAATDPDRPQPRRNLALALFKRAKSGEARNAAEDYSRGLELLNDIAVSVIRDGDEGIDLVSLVEANAELPRALKAGAKNPLDKRLIALLDSDLRIVIEWTTERTDIDLWVIEPTREKAYYRNQRTKIGGHVSNDMTDGYGPEEYMIRNAMRGKYDVRAHVYSSDRINPNGASILTARLIRNFGRPDQSEQIVDVELMGEDREDRKLGVVTVGK